MGAIPSKKYMEIGFGNRWFLRTELEEEDGTEREIKGIHRPFRVKSVYVTIWVGKTVLILDSKEGIRITKKPENRLKAVIGFVGT
ncbi:DUF3977 family protein [Paenibacillus sp. CC-CFT747]|nr:DUF3977 family protein [Paenibacillus sp. CC-CFT747]